MSFWNKPKKYELKQKIVRRDRSYGDACNFLYSPNSRDSLEELTKEGWITVFSHVEKTDSGRLTRLLFIFQKEVEIK